MVVPAALKALRLKPHRKFSRLGDLSKEFGWKSHAVLARLEEKRKVKSMEFYKKRLADLKAKAKTAKGVQKDLEKAIGSDKKLVDELNLAYAYVIYSGSFAFKSEWHLLELIFAMRNYE